MRNWNEIIGKRLIYSTDTIIYKRFPNSEFQKTLPAGKASPVITGYLSNGWFQVKGTETADWYLWDAGDGVEIVDAENTGTSSMFKDLSYWLYDFQAGTEQTIKNTVTATGDALKEGLGKTKEQITFGARQLAKELRYVLIGLIALLIIILLNKIT